MLSRASFLTIIGLVLLIIIFIPVTRVDAGINTSFIIQPGVLYGPNEPDTRYHTHVHFPLLSKSILKGVINVTGEAISLTAKFYNTEHLKNVTIKENYQFIIDPADDLYVFIFDNSQGTIASSVNFELKEVWVRTIAMNSLSGLILGLIGLLLVSSRLLYSVLSRLRKSFSALCLGLNYSPQTRA